MGCAGLGRIRALRVTRALFGLQQISGGEVEIKGRPVVLNSTSDAIRHGIYMLPEETESRRHFPGSKRSGKTS